MTDEEFFEITADFRPWLAENNTFFSPYVRSQVPSRYEYGSQPG